MEVLLLWLQNWGALAISVVSLVLAVISLIQSGHAQSIQNKVNQLELQIKQNELDRIKKEQDEAHSSCVEARVICMGSGKYRLKVWNSGNTTVSNVSASFPKGDGPMIIDSDKQPYDILEPNKSYEMCLIRYGGSASKFKIRTEWTDIDGERQSKIQMGDY